MKKIRRHIPIRSSLVLILFLVGLSMEGVTDSSTGKPPSALLVTSSQTSEHLQYQKDKFQRIFSEVLSQPARNAILDKCGNPDSLSMKWDGWLQKCRKKFKYSPHFDSLRGDLRAYEDWQQIFPVEGHPDVPGFAQDIQEISKKEGIIREKYISSHSQGDIRGELRGALPVPSEYYILTYSEASVFIKKIQEAPFLQDRKEFLDNYKCKEKSYLSSSILDCYDSTVGQKPHDRNCIKELGFEKCKPVLEKLEKCPEEGDGVSSCVRGVVALHACTERKNAQSLVGFASELSRDDKNSMAYICWKAAAQGAQCCINPDQCPTDGAFRNIASQLQKAAPGLVQAFAGLEAIKGNYQEACQANLMANAVGPLSQLQTKTCGDSATACEETCDKKVQDFKESFKKAVLGEQKVRKKQAENPLTIDGIVTAARAIEGDNPGSDSDTDVAKDIKTCAEAVVYLNNKFKKKTDDKKSIKLSEKLSHASLVDCGEEVFKYSGGSGSGGSGSGGANSAGGLGGMSPMAAAACRQGHPSGPLPPRAPIVGPTPNPGMGPGNLFGSKTRRGLGGNFTAPGAGVPPGDEFIEPKRGPAGANALNGGWTDTGGSGGGSGGSGSGGSGLPGSPSRDDEGGSGDTGDNLPIAYPEAFDSGGGGLGSGGGDMRPEQSARMQMAKYMERKDLEEARRKEEERKKKVDEQGSIFSRLSQTIRAYCQQENCSEE